MNDPTDSPALADAAIQDALHHYVERVADSQAPAEHRAVLAILLRGDWRVGVIGTLAGFDPAEPNVRFSVLSSAFGLGLRIEDLPVAVRGWLAEFLVIGKLRPPDLSTRTRRSMAKQRLGSPQNNLALAIVAEIVRSPGVFTVAQLADLMARIKLVGVLFQSALSHPDFASFPDALRHCLDGACHQSAGVASTALAVLLKHWPADIVKVKGLVIAGAGSSQRSLRSVAARALGGLKENDPEISVVPVIRRLLRDTERSVRKEALAALVRVLGGDAAAELTVALHDPAPLVRVEACQQIALLGDLSLVEPLLERANDVASIVRRAAFAAISQLDRAAANRSVEAFLRNGI